MSEILNIQELKKMAHPVIPIPNFDNSGTINVRVQRPRLMSMAAGGKIPNHLLGTATRMVSGQKKQYAKANDEDLIKDAALMMELYCKACLVEPTYEEFKDIMTDEQADAIFAWATGTVKQLDSFRTDKGDGTSNNNGKALPKEAK